MSVRKFVLIILILIIALQSGGCRWRHRRAPVMSRPGSLDGVSGLFHTLKFGESLWYLSRLYEVPLITIKEKNPSLNANAIPVGKEIFIPGDKRRLRAKAYYNYKKLPKLENKPQKKTSSSAYNKKPSKTGKTKQQNIPISKKPVKKSISDAERKRLVKMEFQWPVRGRITSQFGEVRKDGSVHSGLDIAAVRETPILASNSGKVEFSGTIRGYGNCLIISHSGDYYTLYAHNHENLVSYGERIRKNQKIATVGNTGVTRGRTGNHLHFEVREGQYPRDPEHYLP